MSEGCDLTAPAPPAPPVQCLRTGRRLCAWWTGPAAAQPGARVGWRSTWSGSGAPSATTTGTAATPPSSAASSVSRRVWPRYPYASSVSHLIPASGYPANGALPLSFSRYGQGEGLVILSNVNCSGLELYLSDCPYGGLYVNNCDHAEDAGVLCPGSCGGARLMEEEGPA